MHYCYVAWHLLLGTNKFIRDSCDFLFLFVLNKLFLYTNRHIRQWGIKFFYRFLLLEVTEEKFKCPTHPSLDAFASAENDSAMLYWYQSFVQRVTHQRFGGFYFDFFPLFLFTGSLVAFLHYQRKPIINLFKENDDITVLLGR